MIDQVLQLLHERRFAEIKKAALDMHYADIAEVFEQLQDDRESALLFFRLLPKETAAETFAYMEPDVQEFVIGFITDRELRFILDDMYLDDYVDLIEEMPANVVKRVLQNSSGENRQLINQYLQYPEDSAGSLMTNEYIYLKQTLTVQQALDMIRKIGIDKETINTCYLIDAQHRLDGVVGLRDLILAQPGALVADIMNPNVISVNTHEDQEEVAQMFSKYDMLAMPVVDNENRLVGIITIDDVIDVLQGAATEDMEKMAAITPSDKPYLKTSVWEMWKSRTPWLLLLMVSATFTGTIITHFESALTRAALVACIPMLMDTGGNAGSQSSVMVIRGLSLGDIEFRDIFRVLWKEIRVALMCGVALAVCNVAKLVLFDRFDLPTALVVCTTLMCTVFFAKVTGGALPMLAKRLGFDPAVMASPILTTIVDAASLLMYFEIATSVLKL
ncbi:MAG: magnesium transporter [Christensenellaceae bacterium]|jgi:magnesium transporter|nr:magnesium transporter [Christensenellaceae bacterium]